MAISINMNTQAQLIWRTPDVESKKVLLHEMVNSFRYKDKQEYFHKLINGEGRIHKLDKLAADIMLADTDKVIR